MYFKPKNQHTTRSREVVWSGNLDREIAVFVGGEPFETNDEAVIEELKKRGYEVVDEPKQEPKQKEKAKK
jgi:organic radical activating enzyme